MGGSPCIVLLHDGAFEILERVFRKTEKFAIQNITFRQDIET